MTKKVSKDSVDYKAQTIDSEHCSVCTMFVEPRKCTLVKGDIAPGGWCNEFKRKSATVGKAATMPGETKATFSWFMPIEKLDKDKRIVYGYASTPARDSDGEIVTLDAVKAALPDYMQWRNIREMHRLSAVGVAEDANIDTKGLFLSAKIVDDAAWNKCVEGVYKGFSIGGRKLDKIGDKITELEMTEISIVDRPANPEAGFKIAKAAKTIAEGEGGYLVKPKVKLTSEQKTMKKMAKVIEALAKDGPPAARDGFSLPAGNQTVVKDAHVPAVFSSQHPDGVVSPNDSRPLENVTRKGDEVPHICEKHGKANCPECKDLDKKEDPSSQPYGDVKYADPGYQEDKKKRYPIDTEKHIRAAWNYINKPKNAGKYSSGQVANIKADIVAAWKKEIDSSGPPSAEAKAAKKLAKRLRKAQLVQALGLEAPQESFLTLHKGMNTVGTLAYTFDSIRGAQRSLMGEAKREGGDGKDKALARKLGTIAQDLAGVISQKASHEGGEALDFSDADDQYLTSMLGEDFDMDKVLQTVGETGDPLTNAVLSLMKKAATPTRAMRMAMAKDNVKKNRKACKAAREAVEEVHKMLKASYIAKAAKKDKGGADDGEIDHAGMMEKLQKAYSEIEKARTFGKAAAEQIEKAAGRSGERGQEAGDAEGGFYEVPAGVKDLSPAAMAGASPGGGASGGQPPMYPVDGSVYPGKAASGLDLRKYADAHGNVPAHIVELVMEKAQAEGQLEALRSLPAHVGGGRQRPFAFDMTKVVGGGDGGNSGNANVVDFRKTVFEGVDVNAIGSGDEHAHNNASAKAIGNFLLAPSFGKSVFDPNFKGAAGSAR